MARSRIFVCAGLLLGLWVLTIGWWPVRGTRAAVAAVGALPYSAYADGPYSVRGNVIVGARNRPYYFHGVARDGLEFACRGDGYLNAQNLALLGPRVAGVQGTFWYGNTVRLPLSEAFWLHGQVQQHCSAASYQQLVRATVDELTLLRLNVIVDLQWTDAGGQSTGGSWQMPDADSLVFWQQMAHLYASYPNVLFELYNEPHPYASTGDPWGCWRAGCQVLNDASNDFYCGCKLSLNYRAVGMQELVDAIRQAGANNLLLIGGLNWGFDLSRLPTYALNGGNLVYDIHPYPYNGKLAVSDWDLNFGALSATYALISAESGEYDCKAGFMQPLIAYFDAHHISWIGWAWYAGGSPCAFPQLVSDYAGTPEPALGTFVYHALLAYAGVVPPRPVSQPQPAGSGPVSKRWYFPGELVGDGFEQVLVLDNASVQDCAVQLEYALQSAPGQPVLKTITLKLAALARVNVPVNRDVGVAADAPHVLVAEVVSVDNQAAPNCPGVVAERAVHLTSADFTGGSALPGQARASASFFFADVPMARDHSVTSALDVLNPGSVSAKLTLSYFAASRVLATQNVTLGALEDSQIAPPAGLPVHVAALLSADQPVVAARSTLWKNGTLGDTNALSGFTTVPGSAQSASDWLLSAGSVGAGFEENLLLANPASSGSADLAITLQFSNGSTGLFHASLAARAQFVWNVNAHAAQAGNATPDLAVEVVSSVPLVVERVVSFRYSIGGGQVSGVTDVPGQPRAQAARVYTFADGYSAPGFDEWLSLQNITNARELITVTLVLAPRPVSYQFYLPAHNRGTIWLSRLLAESTQSTAGLAFSLVVQSDNGAFMAERCMYWNMAGSQGGSDITGYA
ncbi:MAG TPA: cellulase family glycosylhydrolase [Ktedonobacteraceae bacterium]